MNCMAKTPIPKDAMIEFSRLTDPKEMVNWNKKWTPWLFEMSKDVEKQLLRTYTWVIQDQQNVTLVKLQDAIKQVRMEADKLIQASAIEDNHDVNTIAKLKQVVAQKEKLLQKVKQAERQLDEIVDQFHAERSEKQSDE